MQLVLEVVSRRESAQGPSMRRVLINHVSYNFSEIGIALIKMADKY